MHIGCYLLVICLFCHSNLEKGFQNRNLCISRMVIMYSVGLLLFCFVVVVLHHTQDATSVCDYVSLTITNRYCLVSTYPGVPGIIGIVFPLINIWWVFISPSRTYFVLPNVEILTLGSRRQLNGRVNQSTGFHSKIRYVRDLERCITKTNDRTSITAFRIWSR